MKNIKKFYEEEEIINSSYYKYNDICTIEVISDIHYHSNVNKELFKILVDHCIKTKPNFIVMPGDLIETIEFIDNDKERNFFEAMIKSLSEVAPVIIVPGNHEIGLFGVKNFSTRLKETEDYPNQKSLKYFESLNKFKNVYFLNNEKVKINGITFIGFNPRLGTYLKKGNPKVNKMLIEDYLNSGLSMAEKDYNILVTHSPHLLKEQMVLDSLSDLKNLTDLVITGHFHDGYLPKKLDKFFNKTNIGMFITPLVAPIPGTVCRGIHKFSRGYLFISQGFRKWTADISLFNAFEKIAANDVEKLIITNSDLINSNQKKYKRR